MLVRDVCNYLNNRFPKETAEEFDYPRIGLIIGSENIEVKNILLTLDLNYEVVNKAIKKGCNMIIAHHPYLFEPLYRILFDSEKGKVIELMFKHQISLYVMHTNLDVGENGVNDCLARKLELENIVAINSYEQGSYLRVGETNTTLKKLANKVKDKFDLSGVRVLGDLNRDIRKVGIVGGSGGKVLDIIKAKQAGCDCYITGEIHLNCSQFAEEIGLCLIEVNHGVEKFVFDSLEEELEENLKSEFNFKNKIYTNLCETDKMITI